MKSVIKVLLVVFLMVSLGCTSSVKEKKGYYIILNNAKENKRFTFKTGTTSRSPELCEILWINDLGNLETYCIDPNQPIDTIRINVQRNNLQLGHKIKGLDYFFYFLQPGDTLSLDYDEFSLPFAGKNAKVENNIFHSFYKSLNYKEVNPEVFLGNDYIQQIYSRRKEIIKNSALKRLLLDYQNLDSLSILIEKNYDYKINKVKNLESNSKAELLSVIEKLFLNTKLLSRKLDNEFSINNLHIEQLSYDKYSIADRIFYQTFYDYLKIEKTNITLKDFEFSNLEKNRYLTQCHLKEIISKTNLEELEKSFDAYLQRFSETNDSIFIAELKIANGVHKIKNHLILKDINGNETSLKNVVESENKIWYVDFWASWCAPCRAAMKHSKNLRNSFKNKDVEIMYLGFNDKESNWKKAIKEEGIENHPYNYLIVNSKSSDFINDSKINAIPRYMIINKEGIILLSNALPPNDQRTKNQIMEFIKNRNSK